MDNKEKEKIDQGAIIAWCLLGLFFSIFLVLSFIFYIEPWKLVPKEAPKPLPATAIDPFDRTDIYFTEIMRSDPECVRSIRGRDSNNYTSWLACTDYERSAYSALLYHLIKGELRALMPLYKMHAHYKISHEDLDPYYVEHLPETEENYNIRKAKYTQEADVMAAFWEKWAIEIIGEADFRYEQAKIHLPGTYADKRSFRYVPGKIYSDETEKFMAYLSRAMDLGSADAWYYYAIEKLDEKNYPNPSKNPYLIKAAELGDHATLHLLGEEFMNSSNEKDCQKGLQYLEKSIHKNNYHALYDLFILNSIGNKCVKRNTEKAFYYTLLNHLARNDKLPRPEELGDVGLMFVYTQALHPVQGENPFPPLDPLPYHDDKMRSILASYMNLGYSMKKEMTEEEKKEARTMYRKYYNDANEAYKNMPANPAKQRLVEMQARFKQSLPAIRAEIDSQHAWIKWSLLPQKIFDAAREEALIKAGKK